MYNRILLLGICLWLITACQAPQLNDVLTKSEETVQRGAVEITDAGVTPVSPSQPIDPGTGNSGTCTPNCGTINCNTCTEECVTTETSDGDTTYSCKPNGNHLCPDQVTCQHIEVDPYGFSYYWPPCMRTCDATTCKDDSCSTASCASDGKGGSTCQRNVKSDFNFNYCTSSGIVPPSTQDVLLDPDLQDFLQCVKQYSTLNCDVGCATFSFGKVTLGTQTCVGAKFSCSFR